MISHSTAVRLSLLCLLWALVVPVFAQTYPTKPVRIIVPYPAASTIDIVARGLADALKPALGERLIVENRAGANGLIGMEACYKAAPDGYAICFTDGNSMTLNPYAYSRLPYEPLDLVPVVHVAELDLVMLVKASLPVRTVRELLDYARARPGEVTWGSGGAGSTMHLYLEWFQAKTGVRFLHVPYKGPAALVQAMAAGEVDTSTQSPGSTFPYVQAGKLRQIAVVAGKKRSPLTGDTPTLAEQGFDLDFRNWIALFFPKGTPRDLVVRWNAEVNKVLADPAFVEKILSRQAMTPTGGSPDDLRRVLEAKRVLGAELAKIANLKYD